MKKTILNCTLAAIVAFGAGFYMSQIMHSSDAELIDAQNAALEKAEIVMDNNNLYDIDGSDDMAEYLDLCLEVDSIYKSL